MDKTQETGPAVRVLGSSKSTWGACGLGWGPGSKGWGPSTGSCPSLPNDLGASGEDIACGCSWTFPLGWHIKPQTMLDFAKDGLGDRFTHILVALEEWETQNSRCQPLSLPAAFAQSGQENTHYRGTLSTI